jgi:hypothetical protein
LTMPIDQEIGEVRSKIIRWFEEEHREPQSVADPKLRIKVKFRSGPFVLYVTQPLDATDWVVVLGTLSLSDAELEIAYTNFSEEKQRNFLVDLNLLLDSNNEVWQYFPHFNTQNRYCSLDVVSRPIFYESLNKERLVHSAISIQKAIHSAEMVFGKAWGYFAPSRH